MSTIPPNLIADLTDKVATQANAVLPSLRVCEPVDGAFDVQELKRVSKQVPAVLVAVLGARQAAAPVWPNIEFRMGMAAYILTNNHGAMTGTTAGLIIAQTLLTLIPEKKWGNPAFGPAQDVSWKNLNSRESRSLQVVLSAVTWTQPVILQASDPAAPVDLQVYASRAPEIGAAHVADYTEVSS